MLGIMQNSAFHQYVQLMNMSHFPFSCTQAKLQARRNRRTAESQRKLEEDEAQRVIAEQRKQMQQQASTDGRASPVAMDTGLLRTPKVDLTESIEEKALKKEQVCVFKFT